MPFGLGLLNGIGLALPAGLNAYIPLLGMAMAQRMHWIRLPQPWNMFGEWWAILLITALLIVEILADKIPTVDHTNDIVQTIVRPAAGAIAMLAATGALGQKYPIVMIVAGIVLAGSVHAVKAASRPVVNVSTGGLGAPVASMLEDIVAVVVTIMAIVVPILAIGLLLVLLAIAVRQIWKWRKKRAGKAEEPTAAEPPSASPPSVA
jgi:uncharacterized membrane protein